MTNCWKTVKYTIFSFIILVMVILSDDKALGMGEVNVMALFCFKNGKAASQSYSQAF